MEGRAYNTVLEPNYDEVTYIDNFGKSWHMFLQAVFKVVDRIEVPNIDFGYPLGRTGASVHQFHLEGKPLPQLTPAESKAL